MKLSKFALTSPIVAISVTLCAALSSFGGDATAAKSGSWDASGTWAEGAAPDGAGATLKVTTYNLNIQGPTNSVTLGHILTPADAGNKGGEFTIYASESAVAGTSSECPVIGNLTVGAHNGQFVMDGNGSDATIEYLPPHANQSNEPRFFIGVPLLLKSDLYIRHEGKKDDTPVDQMMYAMFIASDIAEDSTPRKVTLANVTPFENTVFDGDSSFTGGFYVKSGIARVFDRWGSGRERHPFGKGPVYADCTGAGCIDLGPCKTGRGQRLYIGGGLRRYKSTTYYNGSIYSTYHDRAVTPTWLGPVTLTSDAAIGGKGVLYPVDGIGGNLALEGDIDDGGNGYSLTVVMPNWNTAYLSGNNTYSGGTVLTSGRLVALSRTALGTGKLTFAGGTYDMSVEGAVDFSLFEHDATAAMNIKTPDEGVYEPAKPLNAAKGIVKTGKGTLVLSQPNAVGGNSTFNSGDVVLDYRGTDGNRLNGGYNYFGGNGKLTIRNEATTAVRSFNLASVDGGCVSLVNEGPQDFKFGNFLYLKYLAAFNFETGSGKFISGSGNQADTKNAPGVIKQNLFWHGETWAVCGDGNYITGLADDRYVTDWSTDAGCKDIVDVTAANAVSVPEGFSASMLRFNTPNGGTPVVLELSGVNTIHAGVILITKNMGNTPVIIRGGSLQHAPTDDSNAGTSPFLIVNYNTEAPVEISSELLDTFNGAKGTSSLMVAGPGVVKITGDNSFLGHVYISGGTMEICGPEGLGTSTANGSTTAGQKYVYIHGGELKTVGSFSINRALPEVGPAATNQIYLTSGYAGGKFNVSGKDDVVVSCHWPSARITINSTFEKTGPGKFVTCIPDNGAGDEFIIAEGVLEHTTPSGSIFQKGGPRYVVKAGAKLSSAGFLTDPAVAGTANNLFDVKGTYALNLEGEGKVTFDIRDTSVSLGNGSSVSYEKYDYSHHDVDYLRGSADIEIVNSGSKTVAVSPSGAVFNDYSGTLTARVNIKGDGPLAMPKATLNVPAGVVHQFWKTAYPWSRCAFGRLTGSGEVDFGFGQDNWAALGYTRDQRFYVGREADETFTFDGTLQFRSLFSLAYYDKTRPVPQLYKTGTNRMRLTNAGNILPGNTVVENGDLLVANDSLPAKQAANVTATLGCADVIVGGADTPANAVPQLLIEGDHTVKNDILVPSVSDSTVLPGVGGENGVSSYTGTVKVFRRTALVANGTDTVVTFSKIVGSTGEDETQTPGLVVKGDGKVIVKSVENVRDFGCDGLGGQIVVEGDYVIPEGAKFVFTGTIPAGVDAVTVLTANSVTGAFASVEGLPDGWTVRVRGNKIVVTKVFGFSVIVK